MTTKSGLILAASTYNIPIKLYVEATEALLHFFQKYKQVFLLHCILKRATVFKK